MKNRVLSGHRPTGKLHLGHYFGTLVKWVELQENPEDECFYFIADWHALTTDYADSREIQSNVRAEILDWISAGLSPEKSVLFRQSEVKSHSELSLLLGMVTPLPWLERNPTYKEVLRDLTTRDLHTFGFLGYPVLQAADILIYRAQFVPVGEDQLPHLELTREIARRFNHFYGTIFPEPQPLLTEFSRVPGLDGRRMSKSMGNHIPFSSTPEEIEQLVMKAYTDPQKIHKNSPGHPEGCVVFAYWQLVGEPEEVKVVEYECRNGLRGCVECKMQCASRIADFFAPMREKRKQLQESYPDVEILLQEGNERAREEAEQTMKLVRSAVFP